MSNIPHSKHNSTGRPRNSRNAAMTQCNFRIPGDLLDAIMEQAADENTTFAAWARDALESKLGPPLQKIERVFPDSSIEEAKAKLPADFARLQERQKHLGQTPWTWEKFMSLQPVRLGGSRV